MQISEAESIVMDVLWSRHPLAADDVVAAQAEARESQEPSIKTVLNRVVR